MRPTVRKFISDTVSMIAFTTIGGMAIELLISRLTLQQSLEARGMAVVVNLFTAWLYGSYRDWLFRISGAEVGGWVRKMLVDAAAYTTYKTPLYIVILAYAGATPGQILAACGTATVGEVVMGRPFGIIMEWTRKKFGLGAKAVVPVPAAVSATANPAEPT